MVGYATSRKCVNVPTEQLSKFGFLQFVENSITSLVVAGAFNFFGLQLQVLMCAKTNIMNNGTKGAIVSLIKQQITAYLPTTPLWSTSHCVNKSPHCSNKPTLTTNVQYHQDTPRRKRNTVSRIGGTQKDMILHYVFYHKEQEDIYTYIISSITSLQSFSIHPLHLDPNLEWTLTLILNKSAVLWEAKVRTFTFFVEKD